MDKNYIVIRIEVGGVPSFVGTVTDLNYDSMKKFRLMKGCNQQDLAFSFEKAIENAIVTNILGVIKE